MSSVSMTTTQQQTTEEITSNIWRQLLKEERQKEAIKKAKKPGFTNNKQLELNYALLNGKVSREVINPATGRKNKTPIAWYHGSAAKPYTIWLDDKTEHGTFCSCPVGLYNGEGNRDCKHQRMLREHINPLEV